MTEPFGIAAQLQLGEREALVRVSGDVDLLTAPILAAVLDSIVDRGYLAVALDLDGLRFVDASGLGVIASRMGRLEDADGALTLQGASPSVARVFSMTGFARLLGPARPVTSVVGEPPTMPSTDDVELLEDPLSLVRHLRRVVAIPASDDVIDGALRLVVALARATVRGADGASVSLERQGQLVTVAATDETALEMDSCQYAAGEGPCVEASITGQTFHLISMEDERRWPSFTSAVQSLGLGAVLSSPLLAGAQPVGALNIYSRNVRAFSSDQQAVAAVLSGETSLLLGGAGVASSDDELSERVCEALRTRETIALAQGVVMERQALSDEDAFTFLRRISARTGQPLREIAAGITTSTTREGTSDSEPTDANG